MKDSLNYFVIINDLLKVHFLWGKHIYIELLRPLESKDFLILSPIEQSIQFIKDDSWYYEKSFKNKSNGDQKEPVYKAKFRLQLRYRDELLECVSKGLKGSSTLGELTDSLNALFYHYTTGIHNKYDYRGCVTKDSRDKKDKKILNEVKVMVEHSGESKVSTLYDRAIDETTNKFSFYGKNYENEVVSSITNNVEYHNELLHTHFSEEKLEVVSSIVSKREEIKRLTAEINADAELVNDFYSNVLSSEIDSWDDVPQAVKDKVKEVGVRLVGTNQLGDRGGILIK